MKRTDSRHERRTGRREEGGQVVDRKRDRKETGRGDRVDSSI